VRPQPCEGSFLVGAYQPAIPGDIRGENSGQSAFDAFPSQSGAPSRWAEAIIGSSGSILTINAKRGTFFRRGRGAKGKATFTAVFGQRIAFYVVNGKLSAGRGD